MDRLRFWTVQAPEYQAMNLLWYRVNRPIGMVTRGWEYMTLEGHWACTV